MVRRMRVFTGLLAAGLLAGQVHAAQIYTEPFTAGSNGWSLVPFVQILATTNGTLVTNTFYSTSFAGNAAQYKFTISSVPAIPLNGGILASNNASSGAFVGNYVTAGVRAISFSLFCTASIPAIVQLELASGTNWVRRPLAPEACVTGRLLNITAALESPSLGDWFESSTGVYSQVVANVTHAKVIMEPKAIAATHVFLLDNFSLLSTSAVLKVDPAYRDYGSIVTGQTKTASFVMTNSGNMVLTGSVALVANTGFSIVGSTNQVLEPGGWTNVDVSFAPAALGVYTGRLNFFTTGGSLGVLLDGQGLGAPLLGVSPAVSAFGTVVTGQSAQLAFTITNSGASTMTGTVAGAGAPFSLSAAAYTLAAGAATNLSVTFSPLAALAYTGAIVFAGNGGGFTGTVTGTGFDAPWLEVSPAPLLLTNAIVRSWSEGAFVLTNRGTRLLTGTAAAEGGAFTLQAGDAYSLQPGEWTTTVIRCTPPTPGPYSNQVLFTSDGGTVTGLVQALGTNAPLLDVQPASFDFGVQATGLTSQAYLIVSNSGSAPLMGITYISGPIFGVISGESYFLAPGDWQQLLLGFTPVSTQAYAANLYFDSNAGGLTNAISGTGARPARLEVTPTFYAFGDQAVLTITQATFVATNSGQVALNGTASATGAAFSVVDGAGFSLAAGGATNIVVQFAPLQAGAAAGALLLASDGGQATNLLSGTAYLPTGGATNGQFYASGGALYVVFGVTSGAWYHVQSSTNLLDGAVWFDVGPTNRAAGDSFQYVDPAPAAPTRSYRLLSP